MTSQHIYRAMDMHLHNQEVRDTLNPHFTLVIPLEAQPHLPAWISAFWNFVFETQS